MLKSFAGGRVFGTIWGSGAPTVLALHGWQRTHRDFIPVFDRPGEDGGTGVVALDLFGFGSTPPPPEAWGTREYAGQLVPLFEESGTLAERVVVVGHSFGGRVAIRLCAQVPGRIERLVLTGVPLLDRKGREARPAAAFRLARRLHRLGLVGDERMEAMRDRYGSADYRAVHGVMREVFVRVIAERYEEELASITCPVDLIWGGDDTEVPAEVATRARPMFPKASLRVLPGVGHLLPTEAPGALRELVLGRAAPTSDQGTGRVDGTPGDPP